MNLQFKKNQSKSLISILVLGFFIIIAIGSDLSFEFPYITDVKLEYLGDGNYRETQTFDGLDKIVTTGNLDYRRIRQGKTRKVLLSGHGDVVWTEEVMMVDGMRNGESITTYPDGRTSSHCFDMDIRINCDDKAAHINTNENSPFQILESKYPYFLIYLNFFGFDDSYVKLYLDNIDSELKTMDFEASDFDDSYDTAIENLSDTPFDSIIVVNDALSYLKGKELVKNNEFRLAVIDKYYLGKSSTYDVITSTYSNFLITLNAMGSEDSDIQGFCQIFDNTMQSYGTLKLDDPFFTDSIDDRIYRAINYIMSDEKSVSVAKVALKNAYLKKDSRNNTSKVREVQSTFKEYLTDASPKDVAGSILFLIFTEYGKGDIIKHVVNEAYNLNNNVFVVPTVITEISSQNSVTSFKLNGFVHEDGGATVSSRGIVWSTQYNPTTNDQKINIGNGVGLFTTTITGLTEGETYYARAFATNSEGTAYGNCVKLVASNIVGITNIDSEIAEFEIYPNPASEKVTFHLSNGKFDSGVLTIINLSGQVAIQTEIDNLLNGDNKIHLDISNLENGIYTCVITQKGKIEAKGKFSIIR